MPNEEVHFDCRIFPCIKVQLQWGAQATRQLETGIVPNPTDDERISLDFVLYGTPATPATDPVQLPNMIDVLPCFSPCQCVRLRWSKFSPPFPMQIEKKVTLTNPDTGAQKTFTVTWAIPGSSFAQAVGKCRRE